MKLLILICFFSPPFISLAQESNYIRITGKTVDSDSIPIPYSHITLRNNNSIGTYSNSNGVFEMKISKDHSNDSITFSCIGYEMHAIKIPNTNDSLRILLKTKAFVLNEVFISSDTALHVVKEAVDRLKTNISKEKSILQGFFREIVRSDKTYDRLIEAAVDVFDKGFNNNGNDNLQFRIREIRQSDDFMDLDWMGAILNYLKPRNGLHGNQPESLFNSNYIRNNNYVFVEILNAPLNEDFFKFVDFNIDSVIDYNNSEILRIGIYPKNDSNDFIPSGYLDVRKDDYAIFHMEYILRLNTSANPMFSRIFNVPEQNYVHKTIIKYKEYEGKMYLNFLYRKSYRIQMNHTQLRNSSKGEGLFYDEKLYITNEIITEKRRTKKFRKKDRQKSTVDLYDNDREYNEDFWNHYNALNEQPLQPNVRENLEREKSLKEQFHKND